jgi:hypothetical protein
MKREESGAEEPEKNKSPIGPSPLLSQLQSKKRKLLVSLIGSTIICVLLTVFAPLNGDRNFYSDVLSIVTSAAAFALSMQIVFRQKLNALLPRLYASLGLGVGMWLAAEAIWAYYELVAGIDTPFPSIADALWLAGYVPFFYFLFGMLKDVLGMPQSLFLPLSIISSLAVMLVVYVMFSIYQNADFTSPQGVLTYVVSTAYPLADVALIVPATLVFIQLRKGRLTSTPWAHLVTATILFIIADVGFSYFVQATKEMAADDFLWMWNPFYNAGYLAIACSLFWHREFFTINEKKLIKHWQEENR